MPLTLVHEDSLETPDGVRVLFSVTTAYVADSVRVWRNGQLELKRLSGSGFVEVPPKKVRFNTAPAHNQRATVSRPNARARWMPMAIPNSPKSTAMAWI